MPPNVILRIHIILIETLNFDTFYLRLLRLSKVKKVSNALQMFCLLNSQTNASKPNPKTTSSDFNRLESVTKIFCFYAISKDICLLF